MGPGPDFAPVLTKAGMYIFIDQVFAVWSLILGGIIQLKSNISETAALRILGFLETAPVSEFTQPRLVPRALVAAACEFADEFSQPRTNRQAGVFCQVPVGADSNSPSFYIVDLTKAASSPCRGVERSYAMLIASYNPAARPALLPARSRWHDVRARAACPEPLPASSRLPMASPPG